MYFPCTVQVDIRYGLHCVGSLSSQLATCTATPWEFLTNLI